MPEFVTTFDLFVFEAGLGTERYIRWGLGRVEIRVQVEDRSCADRKTNTGVMGDRKMRTGAVSDRSSG